MKFLFNILTELLFKLLIKLLIKHLVKLVIKLLMKLLINLLTKLLLKLLCTAPETSFTTLVLESCDFRARAAEVTSFATLVLKSCDFRAGATKVYFFYSCSHRESSTPRAAKAGVRASERASVCPCSGTNTCCFSDFAAATAAL